MSAAHTPAAGRRAALRGMGACAAAALLAACGDASGRKTLRFHSLDISRARYAQDFSLLDMNGQRRSMADFRGKVVAMFFGYAYCPDVCPTTLAEMVRVKQLLGEQDGQRLQVLFVTVDPERDTPEVLKPYMQAFDPSFLALIPSAQEMQTTIAPQFKVYYRKVEGSSPQHYTIDHTAGTLLFDPQGRVRLHSNYGSKPENVAQDIAMLLHEAPA